MQYIEIATPPSVARNDTCGAICESLNYRLAIFSLFKQREICYDKEKERLL